MRARRACSEILTYGGFHENLFSGTRGWLLSYASHERNVLAYRKLCVDDLDRAADRLIGEMNRAVSELNPGVSETLVWCRRCLACVPLKPRLGRKRLEAQINSPDSAN